MNKLNELSQITKNKEMAEALDVTESHICNLLKKDTLSAKMDKNLDKLSFTNIQETENFKRTVILESK